MIHTVTIEELIQLRNEIPLADVRSPGEFVHGHINGAFNLPLFSNSERAQVGTTYKKQGREAAILLGFDLTGPNWSGFIRHALDMAPQKRIGLYCWRGGMRSGAMAWAFDLYGFEVYLLKGGYKSYRNRMISHFEKAYELHVIGGKTGSGKTKILQQLHLLGEQVIDLEDLAQHQGSSYGTMNKLVQPTQEQFENSLGECLGNLNNKKRTWIEDESSSIGKCIIPRPLWKQMLNAGVVEMNVPVEQRIASLLEEYGRLDKTFLITCTERIKKRLGPEQTKHAVAAITEDRMEDFIKLVITYYDKTYHTGLVKRNAGQVIPLNITEGNDHAANAKLIINLIEENGNKRN